MGFLNPLLLFGMAAIVAPIIIHMFMNRRIKQVAWAATRFLKTSIQKNQKRMRLEDILLLLLRCVLLILLALCMARPIFRKAGPVSDGRSSETAVIAIDNSYSMDASDGGPSRFDMARKVASQVIDSMPQGSSVSVMFFSDVVRAPIPEPTFDLNLARKVVNDGALSDRATDVKQVIGKALDTLSRHPVNGKIYLITDGQANGWPQFDDITKMLRNDAVKSTVILVGSPEDHNLCVSDLQLAESMASVGDEAEFNVGVTNFGVTEANDVAVRLSIDGEAPCDDGIIASISPGATKQIALFTKFRTPGYHTVSGEINADNLPADDKRTIALRALDDVRVLLVSGDAGDTSEDSVENATFYLANALVPVPLPERQNYFVKTKTISPDEMDSVNLSDYEAVVLADVPKISQAAVDALSTYLTRGGGLIIFPGPKTEAAFYNDNFAGKYNLLPAALGDVRGKPGDFKTVLHLQARDYENRIVSMWSDPAAGTLATADFFCSLPLTPVKDHAPQAGEPQVVVKYSDGSPAIMERTWGRGLTILFSSSANTIWNDLPLHSAYLPLIDQALGAIIDRQNAHLNVPAGSEFELVCNPDWVGKDVLVTHSGDKGAGSLRRVTLVDGTPLLRFDETDKAGVYEAAVRTDPPVAVEFAVQSNPVESNLEGLSPSQLDSLSQVSRVVHWAPDTRLDTQALTKETGGAEIWSILAILVIVAACAETLMAGFFSASR